MTRTEERECLMQLFFQMEIQNDYSDRIKESYLKENFNQKQESYARKLCDAVLSHLEEIDEKIDTGSRKQNTKRMAKVDLAIARLAVGEILYMESIPDPVAIDEAVNMARKYSTEESRKFINGLLGQIVKKKNES